MIVGTILGLVLAVLCLPVLMFLMRITIGRIIFAVIGIPLLIIGYIQGNPIMSFSGLSLSALALFGGESK